MILSSHIITTFQIPTKCSVPHVAHKYLLCSSNMEFCFLDWVYKVTWWMLLILTCFNGTYDTPTWLNAYLTLQLLITVRRTVAQWVTVLLNSQISILAQGQAKLIHLFILSLICPCKCWDSTQMRQDCFLPSPFQLIIQSMQYH